MQKNVQCLFLKNKTVLISEVVEVCGDIGEPDCKLIKPYEVLTKPGCPNERAENRIVPWLDFTAQDVILLRSDDVLTFVEPTKELLDHYLKIT